MSDESKLKQKPGGWEGRFRCGPGPRRRVLIAVKLERDAESRARRMREVIRTLSKAGRIADACDYLTQAASAPSAAAFAGISRAALDLAKAEPTATGPVTFRDVCEYWLSGMLHQRFPKTVPFQSETHAANNRGRFALHIYPRVGNIAARNFTQKDFDDTMKVLSKRVTGRDKIAGLMVRVLDHAVRLKLIDKNPIDPNTVPPARAHDAVAFTYLYPDEDAQLLGCKLIPFERRLFWGLLTRNGCRSEEAGALTWRDLDLVNGVLNLDKNKTKVPRHWELDGDVLATLIRVKPKDATLDDLVFPWYAPKDLAAQLRRDLKVAGLTRPALTDKATAYRRPLRVHDLRATFVTLALACGWTEAQVMERTGHTNSIMVARYRRRAGSLAESRHCYWLSDLEALFWPTDHRKVGHGVGQVISIQRKKAASGSSSTTTEWVQEHAGTRKPAAKRPPAGTGSRLGPPPRGGVGQTPVGQVLDGPERDLTVAIANATAAGKWKLAERLTVQLEGLIAAGLPKPR